MPANATAAPEHQARETYGCPFVRRSGGGTRFTYDHTGFSGPGGLFMAKLLGSVRKKMLTVGLPAVLDDLDDTCEQTGWNSPPVSP